MNKSVFFLLCLFPALLALAMPVTAQVPSLPLTLKGGVFINNAPAPAGTLITAEIRGQAVSSFEVAKEGLYAMAIEASGNQNEPVKIFVNGIYANATATLESGKVQTLDLYAEIPANGIWLYAIAILAVIAFIMIIMAGLRHRGAKTGIKH